MFQDLHEDSESGSEDFVLEASKFITDEYFGTADNDEDDNREIDLCKIFPVGAHPSTKDDEKFYHELYVYALRLIALPLAFSKTKHSDKDKDEKKQKKKYTFTKAKFQQMKERFKNELESHNDKLMEIPDDPKKKDEVSAYIYYHAMKWYYDHFLLRNAIDLVASKSHTLDDFLSVFRKNFKTMLSERGITSKKNIESWMEKCRILLLGGDGKDIEDGEEDGNGFEPEKGGGGANKDILLGYIRNVFEMDEATHKKYINEYKVYEEEEQIDGVVQELNNILEVPEEERFPGPSDFLRPEMFENNSIKTQNRAKALLAKLGLGTDKNTSQEADNEEQSVMIFRNGHKWINVHFSTETSCDFCENVIWGLGKQGLQCMKCSKVSHKKCSHLGLECLFSNTTGFDSQEDKKKRLLPKVLKLSKHFSTTLKVAVSEAKGGIFDDPEKKQNIYIQIEINGVIFRTDEVSSTDAVFHQQCPFDITEPLPEVKLTVFSTSRKRSLNFNDQIIAKVYFRPIFGNRDTTRLNWYAEDKAVPNPVELRCGGEFGRPNFVTKAGFLYCCGGPWKRWKKRYFVLLNTNEGKPDSWALFEFKTKDSGPHKAIGLKGHVVDFCTVTEADAAIAELNEVIPEGEVPDAYAFKLMAPGESETPMIFISDHEDERQRWVHATHRSTGQTMKPKNVKEKKTYVASINVVQFFDPEVDGIRSIRVGLPNPNDMNQFYNAFLRLLFNFELAKKNSLGWLSPEADFLIHEFCARYATRDMFKNVIHLKLLTDAVRKTAIDPLAIKVCLSHIVKNLQGSGVLTRVCYVTFSETMTSLKDYIFDRVLHYKTSFPFGRPEGAVETSIYILEEIEACASLLSGLNQGFDLKECLSQGLRESAEKSFFEMLTTVNPALEAGMDGNEGNENNDNNEDGREKSDQLSAEEFMKQLESGSDHHITSHSAEMGSNKTNYAQYHMAFEELNRVADLMLESLNLDVLYFKKPFSKYLNIIEFNGGIFFANFKDMMEYSLSQQQNTKQSRLMKDVLDLFVKLTQFLFENHIVFASLNDALMELFSPIALRYLDDRSTHIIDEIDIYLAEEQWATMDGAYKASSSAVTLYTFFQQLLAFFKGMKWPEKTFSEHLVLRIHTMMQEACTYYIEQLEQVAVDTINNSEQGKAEIPKLCTIFNNCYYLIERGEQYMEHTKPKGALAMKAPVKLASPPPESVGKKKKKKSKKEKKKEKRVSISSTSGENATDPFSDYTEDGEIPEPKSGEEEDYTSDGPALSDSQPKTEEKNEADDQGLSAADAFEGLIYDGTTEDVVLEGKFDHTGAEEDEIGPAYRQKFSSELMSSFEHLIRKTLPFFNQRVEETVQQISLLQDSEGFSLRSLVKGGSNLDNKDMKKAINKMCINKDGQIKLFKDKCNGKAFETLSKLMFRSIIHKLLYLFKSDDSDEEDSDIGEYNDGNDDEYGGHNKDHGSTNRRRRTSNIDLDTINERQVEFIDRSVVNFKKAFSKYGMKKEDMVCKELSELEELIQLYQNEMNY
eukprot:Nk52_evm27s271 gene=Nk52_evmTU27s271